MRIKVDWFSTYIARVHNSVDTNLWRNGWGVSLDDPEGQPVDFLDNGRHSCALHVSGILSNFAVYDFERKAYSLILCPGVFTRVHKLYEGLLLVGWKQVDVSKIEPGDILFWEELSGLVFVEQDHSITERTAEDMGHVGFYIGDQKAISVYYKTGNPQVHDYMYRGDHGIFKGKEFGVGKEQREILFALRGTHLFAKMP